MARHEEIPSSFAQQENLDIKKMISSTSHEVMFNADELEPYEDLKFELSEKHQPIDDLNEVVEMGSYLREHVTNVATPKSGARSAQSNSDFVSTPELVNSNGGSSDEEETYSEIFDESSTYFN